MPYTLSLTTAGQAKITAAITASSTVTLTQIAVGSSATALTVASTALGQERYRAAINNQSVVGNALTMTALVPSTQGGWYIRELAVFDIDGTLIAFSQFPETYKPLPSTDSVGVNLTLTATLNVINASAISVTVSAAALVAVSNKATAAELLSGTPDKWVDAKEFRAGLNVDLATRLRPRPVQMANRCVNPTAPLTNSSTETQGQAKLFHRSGAAGYTGIQFKYVNRSNANANITDNLTSLGSLTVKAALEYNSVIYPVTFNGGAATVTLLPGAEIWSDPLGIIIPSGGTFFERNLVICAGGSFVRGSIVLASRSEGTELGTSLTDKVYSGTITAPVNSLTSVYSAVAIRGLPLNRDYGSVVVLMDSLASGVGSSTLSEDRGFADKAFSGLYGVCNVAVSGGTLAGWNSTADARYRRQIINDLQPSLIVAGSGGNDLNNASTTAASVITLLQAFWTQLKVYNCPIVAWTIPPRTSSTDSWRTYANQTVNSPNVNWESERLTLNTYLRTQAVAQGYVAQVIDFAATVEDGGTTQSGRWKSDGVTANLYTSDGAHPNDIQSGVVNAQALIGALINTSLATAINTK